jgi:Sugar kinases, ribokinase family
MFDVVALGELLIDFTAQGTTPQGIRLFAQNPGGAPANLLCALANLGASTGLIGKVGGDMHGHFLRQTLLSHRVDTRGLLEDSATHTTLAFVNIDQHGERQFAFVRGRDAADLALTSSELNQSLLQNTRVFHIGSLSLTAEPARSATLKAVQIAAEHGAIISYDPNYRAPLWPSEAAAAKHARAAAALANIIKLSDQETRLLTGHSQPEKAASALLQTADLVAVTLGEKGVYIANRRAALHIPGFAATVVDTTGAGDAFLGGFLFWLTRQQTAPAVLSAEQLRESGRFANAVASLCVEQPGGIPAMPLPDAVAQRLQQQNTQ